MQRQGINSVRIIKAFLFSTLLLFTAAIVIVEVILALAEASEVKYNLGMAKSFAVGYFIGAWFAGTISILVVYLVADIAESQRSRHRFTAQTASVGRRA